MASRLITAPKPVRTNSIASWGAPVTDISLVFDEYSNKYYSPLTYDQYTSEVRGRQAMAQTNLDQVSRSGGFGQAPQPHMSMGGMVDPVEDAKAAVAQTMSIALPKKEDYIQSYDVINSYKAFSADWNTFFERNYKNPRISEENANSRARGIQRNNKKVNWFNSMQDLVIENSSMPSSKKSRGTGLVAKADTFSGGLEAGLGV